MMNIAVTYYINDKVRIVDVGIIGTVIEIKISSLGYITYLIEYWNNGEIRTVWQDDRQIEISNKHKDIDVWK